MRAASAVSLRVKCIAKAGFSEAVVSFRSKPLLLPAQISEDATINPGLVERIARGAANGLRGASPRNSSEPICNCFSLPSECMKPSKSSSLKISEPAAFSARFIVTNPPEAASNTGVVALLSGDKIIRAFLTCNIFSAVNGIKSPKNKQIAKINNLFELLYSTVDSNETDTWLLISGLPALLSTTGRNPETSPFSASEFSISS